jgi:hypothetical protein
MSVGTSSGIVDQSWSGDATHRDPMSCHCLSKRDAREIAKMIPITPIWPDFNGFLCSVRYGGTAALAKSRGTAYV